VARQLPLSLFEHSSSRNIACFTRKRVSLRNLKTKANMATKDSTNPLLLTQKDWPIWFQFIRQEASFAKIWDYINLDKTENEIKENNEPAIPTIVAAPTAPVAVPAAPIAPVAVPIDPVAPAADPAAPVALVATPVDLAATPSTGTAIPGLSSQ